MAKKCLYMHRRSANYLQTRCDGGDRKGYDERRLLGSLVNGTAKRNFVEVRSSTHSGFQNDCEQEHDGDHPRRERQNVHLPANDEGRSQRCVQKQERPTLGPTQRRFGGSGRELLLRLQDPRARSSFQCWQHWEMCV